MLVIDQRIRRQKPDPGRVLFWLRTKTCFQNEVKIKGVLIFLLGRRRGNSLAT